MQSKNDRSTYSISNNQKSLLVALYTELNRFLDQKLSNGTLGSLESFALFILENLKNTPLSLTQSEAANKLLSIIQFYVKQRTDLIISLNIELVVQNNESLSPTTKTLELNQGNGISAPLKLRCHSELVTGITGRGNQRFYFKPILNDGKDSYGNSGNCGYRSMDTTRNTVKINLINAIMANKKPIIKKIADQLYQDFLSAPDLLKLSSLQLVKLTKIQGQINNQEQAITEINKALKTTFGTTQNKELQDLLSQCALEKKNFEDALNQLLCSQEVTLDYLEYNMPDEWMSVGMAIAWVETQQIALCVWRERNESQLYLIDELTYMPRHPVRTINIRQTQGATHFEGLELITENRLADFYVYETNQTKAPDPIEQVEVEIESELDDPIVCDDFNQTHLPLTLDQIKQKLKTKDLEASTIFMDRKAFFNDCHTLNSDPILTEAKDAGMLKIQFTSLLKRLETCLLKQTWIPEERHQTLKDAFETFALAPFKRSTIEETTVTQVEFINTVLHELIMFFNDVTINDDQKMRLTPVLGVALQGLYSNKWEILQGVFKEKHSLQIAINSKITEVINSIDNDKVSPGQMKEIKKRLSTFLKTLGSCEKDDHLLVMENLVKANSPEMLSVCLSFFDQYTALSIILQIVESIREILSRITQEQRYNISAIHEQLDLILFVYFGVESKNCIHLTTASDKPYSLDLLQLKVELTKGLIHRGVLSPNLLSTFTQFKFNQNATLFNCEVFPKLSFVQSHNRYKPKGEYLLSLDGTNLTTSLMGWAIHNKNTELVVFLMPHKDVTEKEKFEGELYLSHIFQSPIALFDFILTLSPAQTEWLLLSDFFTHKRIKATLPTWSALRKFIEITAGFKKEIFITRILNEFMTDDYLQFICQTSCEPDPKEEIWTIRHSIKSLMQLILFDNKVTSPLTISAAKTGTMLVALCAGTDYLSNYFQNTSSSTIIKMFSRLEDIAYLLKVEKDTEILLQFFKAVDSKALVFWNGAAVEIAVLTLNELKDSSTEYTDLIKNLPKGFGIMYARNRKTKLTQNLVPVRNNQGAIVNAQPQTTATTQPTQSAQPTSIPQPTSKSSLLTKPTYTLGMPAKINPNPITGMRISNTYQGPQLNPFQPNTTPFTITPQWPPMSNPYFQNLSTKIENKKNQEVQDEKKCQDLIKLVSDKKTFFRSLSEVPDSELTNFLKAILEIVLKGESKELEFLKPKNKVKSITPLALYKMCLQNKEILSYYGSPNEYYALILKLILSTPGKTIDHLLELDKETLKKIFLDFKNISKATKELSDQETQTFLEFLIKNDLLVHAIINTNEPPTELLKQLIEPCKTMARSPLIKLFIDRLDKEQIKTIFTSFDSLIPLLRLWDKNSARNGTAIQGYRKDILQWALEKQLLEPKTLHNKIILYYEINGSDFLSKIMYRDIKSLIVDTVKNQNIETITISPPQTVSQQSIFKPDSTGKRELNTDDDENKPKRKKPDEQPSPDFSVTPKK